MMQDDGCRFEPMMYRWVQDKPELVGLAVVVGAGVNAPPKPPNSPPGAAVVAGTAVLEAPAGGMQLDLHRLKQTNII